MLRRDRDVIVQVSMMRLTDSNERVDWPSGPLKRGMRMTAYCSTLRDYYDGLVDNRGKS
jgi:hypothetical protein